MKANFKARFFCQCLLAVIIAVILAVILAVCVDFELDNITVQTGRENENGNATWCSHHQPGRFL